VKLTNQKMSPRDWMSLASGFSSLQDDQRRRNEYDREVQEKEEYDQGYAQQWGVLNSPSSVGGFDPGGEQAAEARGYGLDEGVAPVEGMPWHKPEPKNVNEAKGVHDAFLVHSKIQDYTDQNDVRAARDTLTNMLAEAGQGNEEQAFKQFLNSPAGQSYNGRVAFQELAGMIKDNTDAGLAMKADRIALNEMEFESVVANRTLAQAAMERGDTKAAGMLLEEISDAMNIPYKYVYDGRGNMEVHVLESGGEGYRKAAGEAGAKIPLETAMQELQNLTKEEFLVQSEKTRAAIDKKNRENIAQAFGRDGREYFYRVLTNPQNLNKTTVEVFDRESKQLVGTYNSVSEMQIEGGYDTPETVEASADARMKMRQAEDVLGKMNEGSKGEGLGNNFDKVEKRLVSLFPETMLADGSSGVSREHRILARAVTREVDALARLGADPSEVETAFEEVLLNNMDNPDQALAEINEISESVRTQEPPDPDDDTGLLSDNEVDAAIAQVDDAYSQLAEMSDSDPRSQQNLAWSIMDRWAKQGILDADAKRIIKAMPKERAEVFVSALRAGRPELPKEVAGGDNQPDRGEFRFYDNPGVQATRGEQRVDEQDRSGQGGELPPPIDTSKFKGRANPDGTKSTILTISIGVDGKEVVIPTMTPDGEVMSEAEAVERFRRTGEHFGAFDSVEEANDFARKLSERQGGGAAAPSGESQRSNPNPIRGARATRPEVVDRVTDAVWDGSKWVYDNVADQVGREVRNFNNALALPYRAVRSGVGYVQDQAEAARGRYGLRDEGRPPVAVGDSTPRSTPRAEPGQTPSRPIPVGDNIPRSPQTSAPRSGQDASVLDIVPPPNAPQSSMQQGMASDAGGREAELILRMLDEGQTENDIVLQLLQNDYPPHMVQAMISSLPSELRDRMFYALRDVLAGATPGREAAYAPQSRGYGLPLS
jgi:hypothetical protein